MLSLDNVPQLTLCRCCQRFRRLDDFEKSAISFLVQSFLEREISSVYPLSSLFEIIIYLVIEEL